MRTVAVRGVHIRMRTGSSRERWRVATYATKEPGTLDWIDRIVKPGDVFFDVGANIGQYGIYAALRNGSATRVFCFEPESTNYAALNANIALNALSSVVTSYPIAIADQARLDVLHVHRALAAGEALHQVGTAPSDGLWAHAQGTVTMSLDDLVFGYRLPCPTHIKIDVDGLEPQIIAGAARLLGDERLESVLVEISGEEAAIRERFAENGFTVTQKQPSSPRATAFDVVFERR